MISNLKEDSSKQMNSVKVWGGKAATQKELSNMDEEISAGKWRFQNRNK